MGHVCPFLGCISNTSRGDDEVVTGLSLCLVQSTLTLGLTLLPCGISFTLPPTISLHLVFHFHVAYGTVAIRGRCRSLRRAVGFTGTSRVCAPRSAYYM